MKLAGLGLVGLLPMLCGAAPITFTPIFPSQFDADDTWPLRELRTFSVQIPNSDGDAKNCGVDARSLETGLRFILGQSGMKLLPEAAFADGYVSVSMLALQDCAVSVQLQVRTITAIMLTHRVDSSVIWQRSALLTGSDAGPRTEQLVEQLAKALVNDWNSANK